MSGFLIIALIFQLGRTITIDGREWSGQRECGSYIADETQSNIVGGRLTQPTEVPWQVYMFTRNDHMGYMGVSIGL